IAFAFLVRHAFAGRLDYQTTEIVSAAGELTLLDDPAWRRPFDPRKRPWFQDIVKAKGQLTWVRPYRSFERDYYCLGAGVAFYGKSGSLDGILIVDSWSEVLKKQLSV